MIGEGHCRSTNWSRSLAKARLRTMPLCRNMVAAHLWATPYFEHMRHSRAKVMTASHNDVCILISPHGNGCMKKRVLIVSVSGTP